jgi:hypothetical protein
MTLPELLPLLTGLVCAWFAARHGFELYGWSTATLGAIVGLLGGTIVGWFIWGALFDLDKAFGDYLTLRRLRRRLQPHFGRYWKAARADEWIAAKKSMHAGDTVTGVVVLECYDGAFLNIGKSFPAFLPAYCRGKLGTRRRAKVGEVVCAHLGMLDDQSHTLHLIHADSVPTNDSDSI